MEKDEEKFLVFLFCFANKPLMRLGRKTAFCFLEHGFVDAAHARKGLCPLTLVKDEVRCRPAE